MNFRRQHAAAHLRSSVVVFKRYGNHIGRAAAAPSVFLPHGSVCRAPGNRRRVDYVGPSAMRWFSTPWIAALRISSVFHSAIRPGVSD